MVVKGLPSKFWIVTMPETTSTFDDICFQVDLATFALQIRGGLDERSIEGIFVNENDAAELANELLERLKENRQMPKGSWRMALSILTDDDFLVMVAKKGNPNELNQAMLKLRREGKIQIFDDGTGDPLIVKVELMN